MFLTVVKQIGELLVCGAWEKSYELTDEGVRVARGESLLPRMTGEDGFRKRVHEPSKDQWDWITTFFESAVEAEWAGHHVCAGFCLEEDGDGESYYSLRLSRSPKSLCTLRRYGVCLVSRT